MNEELKTKIAENFGNTQLGYIRIRRNLHIEKLSDIETEHFLREIIIATPLDDIETRGKNHYFVCARYNAILTINAHSLTVITAKTIQV